MSQWRSLGSKKIPNPTTVIPPDQWTHKHTRGGERGTVGFRAVQNFEVEWWFFPSEPQEEEEKKEKAE